MDKTEIDNYYFYDNKGRDRTLLKGIFAWQAYYFNHLNPYKFYEHYKHKLTDEDFISDNLGKRIRPDVDHLVHCLETLIEVQQRKEDGKLWISSNWLHDPDCYASSSAFGEEIGKTFRETSEGDEKFFNGLWEKYIEITDANRKEFRRELERYFRGGKMSCKNWDSAYVLAASRPWIIKNREQLDEALEVEHEHFRRVLEEFIWWLREKGLNLGDRAEESFRKGMSELYARYPCKIVKNVGEQLIKEDGAQQSDVYIWWGGEPTDDNCYAIFTIFFEVDPDDMGTPRFDENISRNLRALINIAEGERHNLVSYRGYGKKICKIFW